MYGIVLRNFQKRIQNVYKTYSFRIQISYRVIIKLLFKEKETKINSKMNFEIDFEKFRHTFGQKLWNSRSDVKSKKSSLKSPQTIQEYYDAFPKFLNSFFFEIIDELYQKKIIVCNWQQRRHEKLPNITTSERITKIVTFITSILLGIAFSHLKIWLSQVLSSLSHML